MGVIMIIVEPDTGHVPRHWVPVMVGMPSAVFGALAGIVFGAVATSAGLGAPFGPIGRSVVGAAVGGSVGVVFMSLLAHSFLTILLATGLSAYLGFRYTKARTPPGDPEKVTP
jgi:hypothetical protein